MIITCDSRVGMGYIYLMPYHKGRNIYNRYKDILEDNDLKRFVDIKSIEIPVSNSSENVHRLDNMKISEKTYKDVLYDGKEFDEEYKNDLDKNGYMEGVELNLPKNKFLTMIQESAFHIFYHRWQGRDFVILTLDKEDNVFDTSNVIYPFSNRKDAFAIVHIKGPYNIGLIKGIISAREDLYPVSYLSKPEFILWDSDGR